MLLEILKYNKRRKNVNGFLKWMGEINLIVNNNFKFYLNLFLFRMSDI